MFYLISLLLGRVDIGAVLVEAAPVRAHPDVLPHPGPGVGANDGPNDTKGQEPRRRFEAVLVDLGPVEASEKPVQTVLPLPRVFLPVAYPLGFLSSHWRR